MQNQKQSRPLAFGLTVAQRSGASGAARAQRHAAGRLVPVRGLAHCRLLGLSAAAGGDDRDRSVRRTCGRRQQRLHLGLARDLRRFMINVWIGRRMLRSVTPIRVGARGIPVQPAVFRADELRALGRWRGAARPDLRRQSQRAADLLHAGAAVLGPHAGRRSALFRRALRLVRTSRRAELPRTLKEPVTA